MAGLLLSGPAGAGKSAEARRIWLVYPGTAAIADFQSIYVALTGDQRGPDGRYPLRDPALLPLVEYTRRAIISAARVRDIYVVATNSDGRIERREEILGFLGDGAEERIIDPGYAAVKRRLAEPDTGELSSECSNAISRWYGRI